MCFIFICQLNILCLVLGCGIITEADFELITRIILKRSSCVDQWDIDWIIVFPYWSEYFRPIVSWGLGEQGTEKQLWFTGRSWLQKCCVKLAVSNQSYYEFQKSSVYYYFLLPLCTFSFFRGLNKKMLPTCVTLTLQPSNYKRCPGRRSIRYSTILLWKKHDYQRNVGGQRFLLDFEMSNAIIRVFLFLLFFASKSICWGLLQPEYCFVFLPCTLHTINIGKTKFLLESENKILFFRKAMIFGPQPKPPNPLVFTSLVPTYELSFSWDSALGDGLSTWNSLPLAHSQYNTHEYTALSTFWKRP